MKAVVCILFLFIVSSFAQGDVITFTNRQGRVYEKVQLRKLDNENALWTSESGGAGKIKFLDLPDYLQAKFGVNTSELSQREFDRAVSAGLFREVNGTVYDLRKAQPGWSLFKEVKLFQILGPNEVLIDPQPGTSRFQVIHAKNVAALSDTERFSIRMMLVGSYSYINKKDDERLVRSYDAGRPCTALEVPEEIRNGQVSSATIISPLIDPTTGLPLRSGTEPGDVSSSPRPQAVPAEVEQPISSGTGFFITEDGYLITNDHVVRGAKKLRIRTGAQTVDVEVVKTSKAFDLAVLKARGKYKSLPLDFDRGLSLGDAVFTIGFPNPGVQGNEPKYTDGKISSLSGIEDDPSQYQISIPVQPGNSGGAIVAENGAVVGVVRSRLNDITSLINSGSVPQNVNYAVKAKYIRDLLETIPGAMKAIKRPQTGAKADNAVKSVEEATAIVLAY